MNVYSPVLSVGQLRMLEIADKIEKLDYPYFNLATWYDPSCGTPSCIAGHAIWEKYAQQGYSEKACAAKLVNAMHASEAAEYFEIDADTARDLFTPLQSDLFPDGSADDLEILFVDDRARVLVTGKWAAAVLRHLVKTGEVNWQIGRDQ
ncbi:hypothetical protein GOC14_07195 [Sinorhizobium meliloti]|nr:hypothetical protein [Sinorhizobium meliloti]